MSKEQNNKMPISDYSLNKNDKTPKPQKKKSESDDVKDDKK